MVNIGGVDSLLLRERERMWKNVAFLFIYDVRRKI